MNRVLSPKALRIYRLGVTCAKDPEYFDELFFRIYFDPDDKENCFETTSNVKTFTEEKK